MHMYVGIGVSVNFSYLSRTCMGVLRDHHLFRTVRLDGAPVQHDYRYDSSDSTGSSHPDCPRCPPGHRRPELCPHGAHVARVRERARDWVLVSGLDRNVNRHLVGLVVGPLLSIFILILFILCFQVEDEVRARANWRATRSETVKGHRDYRFRLSLFQIFALEFEYFHYLPSLCR